MPSDGLHPDGTHEIEIYTLLRRINTVLETYHRSELLGQDLTVPQFTFLSYVPSQGISLSEMSLLMLCDNSNLTGIVERLLQKGYIQRKPDVNDRRVSLICLTPLGEDKVQTLRPRLEKTIRERVGSLPEQQVEQLHTLLRDLDGSLIQETERPRREPRAVRS